MKKILKNLSELKIGDTVSFDMCETDIFSVEELVGKEYSIHLVLNLINNTPAADCFSFLNLDGKLRLTDRKLSTAWVFEFDSGQEKLAFMLRNS